MPSIDQIRMWLAGGFVTGLPDRGLNEPKPKRSKPWCDGCESFVHVDDFDLRAQLCAECLEETPSSTPPVFEPKKSKPPKLKAPPKPAKKRSPRKLGFRLRWYLEDHGGATNVLEIAKKYDIDPHHWSHNVSKSTQKLVYTLNDDATGGYKLPRHPCDGRDDWDDYGLFAVSPTKNDVMLIFGKHCGRTISELISNREGRGYIQWLIAEKDKGSGFPPDELHELVVQIWNARTW